MSVASQSLMDNVTYEDLYHRWEQGNWSAYDLDFSKDKEGWDSLSDIQRRSAMWIYSMFFYGEDRVADTLAPYVTAAPTEEQQYFLATQQVDEVRHSVFFHRFFKEVIGVEGDSIQQTLASTLPQLNWGYRGIFDRLEGWLESLGIEYKATPEIDGCFMHRRGRCVREYRFAFRPTADDAGMKR